MPVPTKMADLSTSESSNSPNGSDLVGAGLDNYLRSIQAIIRTTNAKGSDIASAATTDIGAATGEFVTITGVTTITSFGTVSPGIVRDLYFSGALTITYNSVSLILPGAMNFSTQTGDVLRFRSLGSGNWQCVGFMRANTLTGGDGTLTVANIAELETVVGVVTGDTRQTLCYSTPGDGGHGTYRYDSGSSATVNGGTVINAAGGVGRWLLQHHNKVSARQFGAKGDGATDDTTVIQKALNAVEHVTFENGTYLHDTVTTTIKNTIELQAGATMKLKNSGTGSSLVVAVSGSSVIGHGTIDGNTSNQTNQCDGVRLTANNCLVKNIKIQNTYRYGIRGIGVNEALIDGVTVDTAGDIGIGIIYSGTTQCERNKIVNCLVVNSGALTTQGGIKIIGNSGTAAPCRNNVVSNNVVYNNTQIGIEVFGNCNHCSVTGNSIRGGTMGISIDSSENISVSGNSIYAPSTYGIELALSYRCSVTGNTIDGNNSATRGVIFSQGSKNTTVNGNQIYNINGRGIEIPASSENTVISSNSILANTSSDYLIYCASNEVTISSNALDGNNNAQDGIHIINGSRINIIGNHCNNVTTNCIKLNASAADTQDNITIVGNVLLDASTRLGLSVVSGTHGANIRAARNIGIFDYIDRANNILEQWGTGTPEGVVTAGIGSRFMRTNGGAATTLYIKESGTGNTGWVGK